MYQNRGTFVRSSTVAVDERKKVGCQRPATARPDTVTRGGSQSVLRSRRPVNEPVCSPWSR